MENLDCTFPTPHSNALIDLDGDCLADLFLMCQGPSEEEKTYQIWLNDRTGGWKLGRQGDLPKGTKQVAFGDMDRDGTMDMIITACPSGTEVGGCQLITSHNVQIPLCSSTSSSPTTKCRDLSNLCVPDPDFNFDFSPTSKTTIAYSIPSILPQRPHLIHSAAPNTFYPSSNDLPIHIKLGDFNLDGFPDLLILTARTEDGARNGLGSVTILENRECGHGVECGRTGEGKKGKRGWAPVKGTEVKPLEEREDVRGMGWVDLDEDGSLDIYLLREGSQGGASRKVEFLKNNFFHDAFFLKSLVLNDACQGYCEPKGEKKYRPYGVSYSGASYKFTILDPAGNRRAAHVGQLPQSSYLSLLTPYSYFGLGRTNNYVESLFVGTTLKSNVSSFAHFTNIEGVIPNSQLVVQPNRDGGWHKELYLRPGDWVFWVIVGIVGAMVLLGALVFALNLKEKREDENEKRRRLHSINFAAL
ncbi:hypothetical protein BT69DRAFT_119975 [Atractiella rhizophila]|nr:hypothetical protein BT69DRAFT_119975 [Atractiella rhizophila]